MDERKVTQYLQDYERVSREYAQSRANLMMTEELMKAVKAQQFLEAQKTSKNIKEAECKAQVSEQYRMAVEGHVVAIEAETQLRYKVRVIEERIGVERTMEATRRMELKALGG